MNDEKRIDLSCLDPSRDVGRWNRRIESIASRAWRAHHERLTIMAQLRAWALPALAIAAAVALVTWVGALSSTRSERASATREDAAATLTEWAAGDEQPSASRILQVLGDADGR